MYLHTPMKKITLYHNRVQKYNNLIKEYTYVQTEM